MRLLAFWAFFFILVTTTIQEETNNNYVDNPAIKKTIQSSDGDVIDCYDIYQQPALKHPSLKNHTLRLKPKKTVRDLLGPSRSHVRQTWSKSGTCPVGTVPIRRNTHETSHFSYNFSLFDAAGAESTSVTKMYAVEGSNNSPYYGAHAEITVWSPFVEPNDYSMTFIYIAGFAPNTKDLVNEISFGWAVYPFYYQDSLPRLHLYYTGDGGVNKCNNNDCQYFVHTSQNLSLGASLTPISKIGGPIQPIEMSIRMHGDDNVWWVAMNHEEIGYIVQPAFNQFYDGSVIMRGGSVGVTDSQQTTTQMGSGHFPSEGVNVSADISNYLCIDKDNNRWTDPPTLRRITNPSCYGYSGYTSNQIGSNFLYGGPGGSGC